MDRTDQDRARPKTGADRGQGLRPLVWVPALIAAVSALMVIVSLR